MRRCRIWPSVAGSSSGSGGQVGQVLDHVQEIAAVAVGELDQARPRVGIERQLMAERALGARDQRRKRIMIQPLQHQHLTARHQRAGQRKGRILGGRADQGDRAVFDLGEQAVLLGAIEAVDLVDEQERGLAGAPPRLRLLVDLAQIGHARHHGGQLDQRLIEAPGEQPGERGLAGAGRAPQDDRAELAAGEHAPERRVGAEQMVLADQLVEGLRAQPIGERLPDRGAGAPGCASVLANRSLIGRSPPRACARRAPVSSRQRQRPIMPDRPLRAATTSIGCSATLRIRSRHLRHRARRIRSTHVRRAGAESMPRQNSESRTGLIAMRRLPSRRRRAQAQAAAASLVSASCRSGRGPESWPLAATSRSTSSITAIGALSP